MASTAIHPPPPNPTATPSSGATGDDEPLPDPTPTNPVPLLHQTILSDNRDQLLTLLRTDPTVRGGAGTGPTRYHPDGVVPSTEGTRGGGGTTTAAAAVVPPEESVPVTFRQCLVFADPSLRTLLLRHVLADPNSATSPPNPKKKSSLDDNSDVPPVPKNLGIVQTLTLDASDPSTSSGSESSTPSGEQSRPFQTSTDASPHGAEVSLLDSTGGGVAATAADASSSVTTFDLDLKNLDVVTYFLRPTPSQTHRAANQIKRYLAQKKVGKVHHRIIYVPTTTALCRKILLDAGLSASLGNVTVQNLEIDLVPLDTDVWTMEYGTGYRECELEGTPSNVITMIARSIRKVQDVAGVVRRVQSLGVWGEEVVKKILHMAVEEYWPDEEEELLGSGGVDGGGDIAGGPPGGSGKGDVDALLVLDRRVDLVTPMLTPLTYEGLLDDVIGIEGGVIRVDNAVLNPEDDEDEEASKQKPSGNPFDDDDNSKSSSSTKKKKKKIVSLPLNGSSDTLYAEVRNQHVEKFGSFLQNQAKALKESHSQFTNKDKKKDLTEIHQFVKQIPIFTQNLRSLTNHIHLAELVKQTTEESTFRERWQTERAMVEGESCYEILEDLIACQYPPFRLLRLLCLQSLVSGGIRSSKFDSLRREVVQTYGYEFLFVLNNLEKVGLLRRREAGWMDTTSSFATLRKLLVLINAEVNTVEPDDVSYVSSGYAPLTARLVQAATQGWGGKEESLRELPGRLIDVVQKDVPEDLAASVKQRNPGGPGGGLGAAARSSRGGGGGRKAVLMVYFVGGVTFMEIAALRFLSQRPSFPFHIVCCTTKIINGSTFLGTLK